MIGTAARQSVVRGVSGKLFLRVLDEVSHTPLTLNPSGHSASLFRASGSLVETVTTGFSLSDENVTLSYTFSSSEWEIEDFCKVVFTISTSSGNVQREIYFSVVKRKFLSLLTDDDLSARHPYLSNQIPSGTNIQSYVQRAWERIENHLWLKMNLNPANIFHPENFLQAHENLTLSEIFLALAYDADARNEDLAKFRIYEKRGLEALDLACSKVDLDLDKDGVQKAQNTRYLSHIKIVR